MSKSEFSRPAGTDGKGILGSDNATPLNQLEKNALGNLNEESVYEVWNGEGLADLRDKHKKLDYESMPICEKCPIPEMNYFSHGAILSSGLLSASTLRKGLALYEKLFVEDKSKKSGSRPVLVQK